MKSIYKSLIICTLVALISVSTSYSVLAGNRDRSGQAGASHLLIDPWARSNGMANAGIAEIRGLESVYSNVAGLTSVKKTEFCFNRTQYLVGSNCGININVNVSNTLFHTRIELCNKVINHTIKIHMRSFRVNYLLRSISISPAKT